MKTVTVKVTEEDIRKGEVWSVRSCPIARAIKRTLKLRDVMVGSFIEMKQGAVVTPARAERFINAFDNGKKVKPFSFKLSIPEGK